MALISIGIIGFLYICILQGRFANWIVAIFQKFFHLDFEHARQYYYANVRNYIDLYFAAAIIIAFFVIFRFSLNQFIKYFLQIHRGIDALIEESEEDVRLSSELRPIEKKINTIKHTFAKRKQDAALAEQRKNDLVVYLAHDLKTPLTSVIGYLTLMRDEAKISEELRNKYLSISLEKAERLEELIGELFDVTRFSLSNITLEYSTVNLSRLLEQLAFEFAPILSEKNLRCELGLPPNIMINCDADKIQRVFDNLLRNAVFYCYNNSVIKIYAAQSDRNVTIRFINSGSTIPEEKLDRLFEQFYRMDASRSSNNGGAGLGLAIAKEIITLHQGTITAKSEDETIEFCVTLPLS